MATGELIGKCHRRHRTREFLEFLDHIDATVERREDVEVHPSLEDYVTHKMAAMRRCFL